MMTQTHTLVAVALFASPKRPARHNFAVILGSLAPDLAIYTLFIWSKLAGIPEQQLWDVIYFSEPMLTFTAIGNSFPLYFAILLLAIYLAQRNSGQSSENESYATLAMGSGLGLFALAAMTHLAGDLPVHAGDAHPHFWPLTDWRFFSPVSYWDRDHYGGVFSLIEALLGIVLSVIIFRRFKAWWVRALTLLAALAYAGVPAYFIIVLGSGAG